MLPLFTHPFVPNTSAVIVFLWNKKEDFLRNTFLITVHGGHVCQRQETQKQFATTQISLILLICIYIWVFRSHCVCLGWLSLLNPCTGLYSSEQLNLSFWCFSNLTYLGWISFVVKLWIKAPRKLINVRQRLKYVIFHWKNYLSLRLSKIILLSKYPKWHVMFRYDTCKNQCPLVSVISLDVIRCVRLYADRSSRFATCSQGRS